MVYALWLVDTIDHQMKLLLAWPSDNLWQRYQIHNAWNNAIKNLLLFLTNKFDKPAQMKHQPSWTSFLLKFLNLSYLLTFSSLHLKMHPWIFWSTQPLHSSPSSVCNNFPKSCWKVMFLLIWTKSLNYLGVFTLSINQIRKLRQHQILVHFNESIQWNCSQQRLNTS